MSSSTTHGETRDPSAKSPSSTCWRSFWRATERMRYPTGPVYRMLLLTGLRLNEAAQLYLPFDAIEREAEHVLQEVIPGGRFEPLDTLR